MARRSQCSSAGDNPLDPNYLPPHYREEYRLAIDALVEEDLEGYYKFLQIADVVDFLSTPEIQYIQSSVQVPQQSHYPEHPEQRSLEAGADGSSDTYWPIHSDLDAPGLDLGWPQLHHFIGPTEVTTLVNPPASDMPSIKDQARRLIKNAQQVIAVVMDMFTDVDMLADILNAAMRNVAVYILLDEQNAHHFVNMVSNCRVNLQSIQFLRVRTVSGVTYHCRSGRSFKGQMMDRFLLTDCRAVLSGNYSFMWSFEKLHRCMAHLFLGQLVSTFDEEFRILFAQSQPLIFENTVLPVEELSLLPKSQYPSEKMALYRESMKLRSLDTHHPDEWARHSYDDRMDVDRKIMPLKKQESLHGPSDLYSRFPSQQSRMDPSFDQGPSRIPMLENPAFKRHSYAEGGHGRFSYPFLQQQGMFEAENQGRQFLRGQQQYPGLGPGPEGDYSGYDKFWSQDYHSADQYSELQDVQPAPNFDPVFNYLSSTRNVDFDQSSEKLLPAADLPFSSSQPRRLSLGQPYACQTSPTPSNPTDHKQLFQEPNVDRKDPRVKRGLRNWRITSYLSAYNNAEDEGMPSVAPQAPDPSEEPFYPIQPTPGIDFTLSKIPNVREFKVPAVPRASQMPSYAKITVREQPKKLPDESSPVAVETKTTPTPSESSSTTEMEKAEEVELKEPKKSVLHREESFRRKYNAAAPRSSRLRSSLIFSSLDNQQSQETVPGQQDGESDKNEGEQTKPLFVSQVLGQRRYATKEPIEWSRYIKSGTEKSKPEHGNNKPDDKDPSNDLSERGEAMESLKPPDVEITKLSPSVPQSKPSRAELPKTDQPVQPLTSLLTTPSYLDMNDPDNRLMFFKELAAKRKAAKAAEAEKSKDKAAMKPPADLKESTTVEKEEPEPKDTPEMMAKPEIAEAVKRKDKDSITSPTDFKDIAFVKKEEPELKETPEKMAKPETAEAVKSKDKAPITSPTDLKDITVKKEASEPETTETEKTKDKVPVKPLIDLTNNTAIKIEGSKQKSISGMIAKPSLSEGLLEKFQKIVSMKACESVSVPLNVYDKTNTLVNTEPSISQSCEEKETRALTDSDKTKLKNSQSGMSLMVSTEKVEEPPKEPKSKPAVKESSPTHPPTSIIASAVNIPSLVQGTDESERLSLDFTSKDFISLTPSSLEVQPSSVLVSVLDSYTQNLESVQSENVISSHPVPSEQHIGSEFSSSDPPVQSSSTCHILPDSSSQITPSYPPSSMASVSTPAEPISSNDTTEDSNSNVASMILPLNSSNIEEEEFVSSSLQMSQKSEADSLQVNLDAVYQLTSPETPSEVVLAHVETDTCHDTSSLDSTTKTISEESCTPALSDKVVPASEDSSDQKDVSEEPEVPGSSEDHPVDSTPSSLSPSSFGSGLPDVSGIEGSTSKSDQNETITFTTNLEDPLAELIPPETSSVVDPGVISNAFQSETTDSPQEALIQATPPPEHNLIQSDLPSLAETELCSSLSPPSVELVLSTEAETNEISISAVHSPSDTNSDLRQITTDLVEIAMPPSTETSCPTELTSKGQAEPDVPCKTPEPVTPESHTSEPVATEIDNLSEVNKELEFNDSGEKKTEDIEATNEVNESTTQESVRNEKINDQAKQHICSTPAEVKSDEVLPLSPQSKQPKSSQSRYHSSTVNVLSSSNLRDDTKLLLEQISANSQSRNESTKEPPVTDDEKEDEADKNAKREKERGIRTHGREQPKSTQEREKVLERIQSMRKERRVYSRFEV